MIRQPTLDELETAFGGNVYEPLGAIDARFAGYGSTGEPPVLSNVKLQFVVGASQRPVHIEVANEPARAHRLTALSYLLFDVAAGRAPRFPLVIERSRVTIPVDGRRRAFTVYTAARHAVACACVREVTIVIRAPSDALNELELRRVEPAELAALLRERDRR